MTMEEFISETDKLYQFYDKNINLMNSYERNIWFEELNKLSKDTYHQIIRECFRTEGFMPRLAKILKIKASLPVKKEDEWKPVDCEYCGGTGIVTYQQKEPQSGYNYLYGARCTCKNGQRLSKDIPIIGEVLPF